MAGDSGEEMKVVEATKECLGACDSRITGGLASDDASPEFRGQRGENG